MEEQSKLISLQKVVADYKHSRETGISYLEYGDRIRKAERQYPLAMDEAFNSVNSWRNTWATGVDPYLNNSHSPSKIKVMLTNLKNKFKRKKTMQEVIAEIHNDFDTAGEKILADAKAILAEATPDPEKALRLKNLGFTKSAPAWELEKSLKKKREMQELAKLVEYYQVRYPSYKFITKDVVDAICSKYGLVFADVERYIGDVPEKNIAEMEAFKLYKEDAISSGGGLWFVSEQETAYRRYHRNMLQQMTGSLGLAALGQAQSLRRQSEDRSVFDVSRINARMRELEQLEQQKLLQHNDQIMAFGFAATASEQIKSATEEVFAKPCYKICAPEKDFDTRGLTKKGHEWVDDPIVLQQVKGGYLIVSKWGLEASDALLVNEVLN